MTHRCLSQGEVQKIRLYGFTGDTADRDRLIFDLLLFCGLRISEALSIRVKDVAPGGLVSPYLTIHTLKHCRKSIQMVVTDTGVQEQKCVKRIGDSIRKIPLSPGLHKSFLYYLQKYKPIEWLFPGYHGNHLNRITGHDIIKRAFFSAGIFDISSHSCRATFITTIIKNGVDVRTAQQLAGHSDPSMTLRYVSVSDDDLKNAVSKMSIYDVNQEGIFDEITITNTRQTH